MEDGVLFYEFETSLGSKRIAASDAFHYEPTDKELSLAKVCFVPAAAGMVIAGAVVKDLIK